MIIDSHTHIATWLETSKAKMSFKENFKMLLMEMERNHVDLALIIESTDNKKSPRINELLEFADSSKKIRIIATINPLSYTKDDLAKLDELYRTKKTVGIKLYTGYQHFYPDDGRCYPVYELCQKYNAPIIFHSGDTLGGVEEKPKIKYSQPIHIDDIAVEFPNLKIIIAHMGNPWLIDCAEVLYKNKNVYADISGLVTPEENFKSPSGRLLKRRIQELIDYSSPKKLLYGTDWPLSPMKDYLQFVKSLGLGEKDLDRVLYKNAQELFNL